MCVEAGVRHVQAANITDEDIDAIIQKGQRATEELNEKMKQYTENAMKFTMDGGIAYEYKDDDDVPEDAPNLKAIAGAHRTSPALPYYAMMGLEPVLYTFCMLSRA